MLLRTACGRWWVLLLKGLCAVALGISAIVWPQMTALTLVYLFGIFTLVDGLGKILGEAAVRAAATIKTAPAASLRGAHKVVTCPGRRVEPGPTPRAEYKFNDADPVNIRLSLLMINDIALAGVFGLPETVTEYADAGATALVIRLREQAAERGLHAKQLEELAAGPHPEDVPGLPAVRDVEAGLAEGGDG